MLILHHSIQLAIAFFSFSLSQRIKQKNYLLSSSLSNHKYINVLYLTFFFALFTSTNKHPSSLINPNHFANIYLLSPGLPPLPAPPPPIPLPLPLPLPRPELDGNPSATDSGTLCFIESSCNRFSILSESGRI